MNQKSEKRMVTLGGGMVYDVLEGAMDRFDREEKMGL